MISCLHSRRRFLAALSGAAALPAAVQAASTQSIRLGIDTYSLHSFRWKVAQMLDYAEARKLDIIQASQGDFESFDEAYLGQIKARADRMGILVEPGFGCISPLSKGWNAKRQGDPRKYLLECIRVTRSLGAHCFKVFVGNAADRAAGTSLPALMESAIKAVRSVRARALDAGVKVAIENHGEFQARQVKTIIEEAGKDICGSCFDSGNPVMLAEDPVLALEILAPYVVTSHFRDAVVYEHPRGAAVQWVALGDGSIDMKLFARRFAELCPKAPLLLEILTGIPPKVLPYLEADYWRGFPDTPASDFARFAALARSGHPFMGSMIIVGLSSPPPEYTAALKQQERVDLDRSLEYARKSMNVGVRWRNA